MVLLVLNPKSQYVVRCYNGSLLGIPASASFLFAGASTIEELSPYSLFKEVLKRHWEIEKIRCNRGFSRENCPDKHPIMRF